jgi:hypothetical protein
MKKIATITFHASYNYGSNLQAYALQEYIKKLCNNDCKYNIINLRTPIQQEMYKTCFEKEGIKNKIKRVIKAPEKKDLLKRKEKFEDFINQKLQVTKEYKFLEEIKDDNLSYDYYISGSDQLWNLKARDFDWANYLEFVKKGKRISYAASFGPKKQTWNNEEKERIRKDLLLYDYLSVREQGSFNNVKELTNIEPEINIDPTMLLNKDEWMKIIDVNPLVNKDYIFLYNLKGEKEIIKIAKKVSKITQMPIVVTQRTLRSEIFYGFEKRFDAGPLEFLNLILNAKLVLSSSFHGTVFSILFNKPFYAINGAKDFRISTLLEKMNLKNRTIEIDNVEEKCKKIYDIEFKEANALLEAEREKSKIYLKKALEI